MYYEFPKVIHACSLAIFLMALHIQDEPSSSSCEQYFAPVHVHMNWCKILLADERIRFILYVKGCRTAITSPLAVQLPP